MIQFLRPQTPEQAARAYCRELKLNPDELIGGYDHRFHPKGERVVKARWRWYVGATAALAKMEGK